MADAVDPAQAVIDPSALFSWLLPDEAPSQAVAGCLKALDQGRVVFLVPDLFPYECANILTVCLRRGRLESEALADVHQFIRDLPLTQVSVSGGQETLTGLSRETGLSAYDAAYLAVAETARCPLISNDRLLVKAARRHRVRVRL
jgi:predicted nucleic acid-binding protein